MIIQLNIPHMKQDELNDRGGRKVNMAEIAQLMRLLNKYNNNIAVEFSPAVGGMYSIYFYEDWKRISHKIHVFIDLMDVDSCDD